MVEIFKSRLPDNTTADSSIDLGDGSWFSHRRKWTVTINDLTASSSSDDLVVGTTVDLED